MLTTPPLVAFVGAKGGTLKTATTAAISHVIAQAGIRTVMLDGDPQGDLTSRSGVDRVASAIDVDAVDISFEGAPPLPLRLFRAGRGMEAFSPEQARMHVSRALHTPDAQLVIMDTPPALGPLTTAALEAASIIIIPAMPGKESLERSHDVITLARRVNPEVFIRILFTMVHPQSNILRWMTEMVDTSFPGMRLPQTIAFDMQANESAVHEKPVTLTAPRSRAALAYTDVAALILRRTGVETDWVRERREAKSSGAKEAVA